MERLGLGYLCLKSKQEKLNHCDVFLIIVGAVIAI